MRPSAYSGSPPIVDQECLECFRKSGNRFSDKKHDITDNERRSALPKPERLSSERWRDQVVGKVRLHAGSHDAEGEAAPWCAWTALKYRGPWRKPRAPE